MLQALVNWSLHNRVVVLALAVLLMVAGVFAAGRARLDVFPEFAPPQVVIQTEAPGLSPGEVEQLVTLPIETAVNGIGRLDVLRSQSIQGLSVITVIFLDGTNIHTARQQVGERLGELAGQLPAGVKPPRMTPLTSSTGRLLSLGFTSKKLSPMDLRDHVQWVIRPKLLGVKGVAQVTIYGGDVRQYQVQVSPDHLAARQMTISQVLEAARQSSNIRGAGFVENDRQRLNLRVEGQVKSAHELGQTVVATIDGSPVLLKDVAQVREAAEPRFGAAAINGEQGVILIVYRQLQSDTPETTRRVEAKMDELVPLLEQQGITYHPELFRQANFIEHAVANVTHSLVLGAVLVAIVLFIFLFNLRTAFISLTAIPLSLLGAIVVLWLFDVSLNTLTLGGLAIAVGEVVDDAIIDVENIYRRLKENAGLSQPQSSMAIVLSASLEVRSAVVYATFIVVLVFLPIFFLSGLQGRLFAPLGYAYVLAVLASLLVALTVTPALSLIMLCSYVEQPADVGVPPLGGLPRGDQDRLKAGLQPPFLLHVVQEAYSWLLRRLDNNFLLVITATLMLLLAGGMALVNFDGNFLPELRENHFVVHMSGLPGTSLPQSLAAGNHLTKRLRENPAVRSVAQQVGRAELGEDTWGVEYSELEVDLTRLGARDNEEAQKFVNRLAQDMPGFSGTAMPFLTERIKETLSGTSATVVVKIFGHDLSKLDSVAQDIARTLNTVPGHDNVRIEPQIGNPELVVRLRLQDAGPLGVRSAHVLDAVHTAYKGAEVGQVYERNKIIDMVVILEPKSRLDADTVANLWIDVPADAPARMPHQPDAPRMAPDAPARMPHQPEASARMPHQPEASARIQLKQVADVFLTDGRFLIGHEGGIPRQVVSCNVTRDTDVASFVAEAERRVGQVTLPAGVHVTFAGEHEARQTAQRELLLLSLAAGAGIVLLLWMAFGSVRRVLVILANLPFALVGGVAAVYLTGGNLDVGSLIGFVTLFGITTRNSIMMVSHWQHLHEVDKMPWGPELIFRGARERLAPVLMTALVTALGLLPIAVGSGEAGREIEGPMALVILGGLVTSTALNLLVLPLLYRRIANQPTTNQSSEPPA